MELFTGLPGDARSIKTRETDPPEQEKKTPKKIGCPRDRNHSLRCKKGRRLSEKWLNTKEDSSRRASGSSDEILIVRGTQPTQEDRQITPEYMV